MICNYCGNEVPDGLRKCIICGADLSNSIKGKTVESVEKKKDLQDKKSEKKRIKPKKAIKKNNQVNTKNLKRKRTIFVGGVTVCCIGVFTLFACLGVKNNPYKDNNTQTEKLVSGEASESASTIVANGSDENSDHSLQSEDDTMENNQESVTTDNNHESSEAAEESIEEQEYDIKLESDESNIQLKTGECREIVLTASGEDLPEQYSLYCWGDPQHCELMWGGWIDEKSAFVYVTGLSEGEESIKYTINEPDNSENVFAETNLNIAVVPNDGEGTQEEDGFDESHYIVSSTDSLHLSVGESKEIMISIHGTELPDSYYLQFFGGGFASGVWGDWTDESENTMPLTFTGIIAGKMKIKITLRDSDTYEEIAHTYVDIEVE